MEGPLISENTGSLQFFPQVKFAFQKDLKEIQVVLKTGLKIIVR